jgi:hypothetical protein
MSGVPKLHCQQYLLNINSDIYMLSINSDIYTFLVYVFHVSFMDFKNQFPMAWGNTTKFIFRK